MHRPAGDGDGMAQPTHLVENTVRLVLRGIHDKKAIGLTDPFRCAFLLGPLGYPKRSASHALDHAAARMTTHSGPPDRQLIDGLPSIEIFARS
jgi:hypothetical protein